MYLCDWGQYSQTDDIYLTGIDPSQETLQKDNGTLQEGCGNVHNDGSSNAAKT